MSLDTSLAFASACVLGFMSSGHCFGMCGGIACALGLQQHAQPKTALLLYHAGRISTYVLLALIFGAALQHVTHRFPWLAPALRTSAGLLLLAIALHIANIWRGINALETLGNRWWRPLQTLAKPLLPADTLVKVFVLGLLWGWLPCALVYSTLVWAASHTGSAALLMLGFGLGTTPVLLASGIFSQHLQTFFRRQQWRYAAALLLAVYAAWTMAIAWQHTAHLH